MSLLYSIAADPLALLVLKDNSINGNIISPNTSMMLEQYAYGLTITVKDKNDIDRIRYQSYPEVSGSVKDQA